MEDPVMEDTLDLIKEALYFAISHLIKFGEYSDINWDNFIESNEGDYENIDVNATIETYRDFIENEATDTHNVLVEEIIPNSAESILDSV